MVSEDIKQIRENYVLIEASPLCEICKCPVADTFYAFPCGHLFHANCLQEAVCDFRDCQTAEMAKWN